MGVGDRIVRGLREIGLPASIVLFIVGFFLFFMGLFYYIASDFQLEMFKNFGAWNAYILVLGLIIFSFGLYYLYSFLKKRSFVLKELKTNKRSEFLKKHGELTATVRRLPVKYKKMVQEKEEQLGI